jgi:hypothetical protein
MHFYVETEKILVAKFVGFRAKIIHYMAAGQDIS